MEEQSNGSEAQPEFEVLARLTPAEFQEVRSVQEVLRLLDTQHRMAIAGSRSLWAQIGRKYQLPDSVEYDPTSGVLFRRLTSSPEQTVDLPTPVTPEEPVPVGVGPAGPTPAPPTQSPPNRAQRRKKRR